MDEHRDALRKKLRDKISGKRKPQNTIQQLAHQMKRDPQTALLSMGIDNTDILSNANSITKNPESVLQKILNTSSTKLQETNSNDNMSLIEDIEEAPPAEL